MNIKISNLKFAKSQKQLKSLIKKLNKSGGYHV